MARSRRKKADELLLAALACGATAESAARQAGVSVRTARRRLADPAFRRLCSQHRLETAQRVTGMVTVGSLEAARVLLTMLDAKESASVRLRAARTFLELGPKMREEADLAPRVAALEQQE
ncbi:MAG: hypothetical protein ACJ8FY_18705 [Gemmataceae bacterium]